MTLGIHYARHKFLRLRTRKTDSKRQRTARTRNLTIHRERQSKVVSRG